MSDSPFRIPGAGLLALTGSGEYLPPMEPVDRALLERLGGPARVVCLPTGAGTEGPDRIAYWDQLGIGHFTRLGVERVRALPVVDRASADDPSLAEQVRAANFVYFSGGKPWYLYDTLRGSRVWAAVQDVLAAGGIAAGCSAGAMIFAERIPSFRLITPLSEGFGFLPGTLIMPHFDELPGAMVAALPGMIGKQMLVGIEGFTALVCWREGWQVLGRGRVLLACGSRRRWVTAADGVREPGDFGVD